MNFKKRANGSWADIPHYIHNASTDTITTLPAVLYPNAATATMGLKGQAVQSGTPTPDNPIMPQGTGERTGNLFDYKIPYASYLQSDGTVIATSYQFNSVKNYFTNDMIGKTLTITIYINSVGNSYVFLSAVINDTRVNSTNRVNAGASGILSLTVTPTSTNDYWQIPYGDGPFSVTASQFMVNFGSAPLSYELYGIKIPISSANTTTNNYLGEVETTRKVKKWVLDGTEAWSKGNYPPAGGYQFFAPKPADIAGNPDWLTTHFKKGSVLNGSAFGSYLSLYPEASILPENATANDFKAWLAAQYAVGTPVTIWYVLATEETGIVNEPLMRIGDYADTLSNVSIPVTAGGDTLSVDTTVQPSEVTVNYKGWHPVADVHEFTGNYTVGTMQTLTISELETHTVSDLQGGEWS